MEGESMRIIKLATHDIKIGNFYFPYSDTPVLIEESTEKIGYFKKGRTSIPIYDKLYGELNGMPEQRECIR
jgi:hypothetical protein